MAPKKHSKNSAQLTTEAKQQPSFNPDFNNELDKILDLIWIELFGKINRQEIVKQLVKHFVLPDTQNKLKNLLKTQKIQRELQALSIQGIPIDLHITEDEEGLPLRIVIEHPEAERTLDLQVLSNEINRIRTYKLTYVYAIDKTTEEISNTVEEIQTAPSYEERQKLIIAFNQKWQGELCMKYTSTVLNNKTIQGNEDTYTVTDASGELFFETSRYPVVTVPYSLEPTKTKDLNCHNFFTPKTILKAATYAAVVGAVATGLYFANNI